MAHMMSMAVALVVALAALTSAQFGGRPSIPNAPSSTEVRQVVNSFPRYLRSTVCGANGRPKFARCKKDGRLVAPDSIIPPHINESNMNFAIANALLKCAPHLVICQNNKRVVVSHGGSVGRRLVEDFTPAEAEIILRQAFPV